MAMHPAEEDREHIRGQRQRAPRPSASPAVCSHCSFSGDLMNAVSPASGSPALHPRTPEPSMVSGSREDL